MTSLTIDVPHSPYFIEIHSSPRKAIELALERGLVRSNYVINYLRGKKKLPISILESACQINKKDEKVPVKYQYAWFCLDKVRLYRKASETKYVSPRVSFHPIYVEPKEHIFDLFRETLKDKTKTELARLCSVKHRQIIYQWVTGKIRPQLTGLLKVCQLLDEDIWSVLDGCKLYGHSCPEEENLVFKNYHRRELLDILVWIKLEGHLSISQPKVETNQKLADKDILDRFSQRIVQLYRINPKQVFVYNNSTLKGTIKDWEGFKLTISSAPLRQILCLRYGIPIGYKCSFVNLNEELSACNNDEDAYKLLSVCIETEGSFTQRKERDYNRPLITFSSLSPAMLNSLLNFSRKRGYSAYLVTNPTKKAQDFRIWGVHSFVKCCFDMFPYFTHYSKLNRALSFLSNKLILKKIWLTSSPDIKSLIIRARNRFETPAKNKALARVLSERVGEYITRHKVNGWLNLNQSISLYDLTALCDLEQVDYFKYIPKYLALVLWANKYISRKRLEEIRQIPDSFKYIEEIKNGL